MVRQALKWGGILAAFVPLAVAVVDLPAERELVESSSVEMEDEISAVVDGLNDRIRVLEEKVQALEAPAKNKARKAHKPRSYKRAWLQQEATP